MTAKLRFPLYVPEKVRLRTEQLLYGSGAGTGDNGWIGVLDELQTKLNQVGQHLHDSGWLSEEGLSALHRKGRDISAQIKQTKDDIDCLERLTTSPDPDLADVYALLEKNLQNDEQVWAFIYAAVSANIEYTRHRDALKSAREHKQEIARLAQALAEQLDGVERTGVQAPDVFWSVRSLLEITDAPEGNFMLWRQMRGSVLGERDLVDQDGASLAAMADDLEDDGYQDLPDDEFDVVEIEEGAPVTTSPEHDRRYAWQVAPSMSDLLKTLSTAANDFEPREHHLIGAALNTQQDSVRSGYIRAFSHLLQENGISLTPPLMRAMAKSATLVLHRYDLDVSYDNVRKAVQ